VGKLCLKVVREWAGKRVQWGKAIGKHEAIAQKIAYIASTTFAMESIVKLASDMANRGDRDLRLEAAACKEWNTYQGWIIDETMQIRGGRGYEKESSLEARGEQPIGVERMMRDFRINRIFEGSSEIMHLIMAREAVDKHLQVAGALVDPKVPMGKKAAALPKVAAFYAGWYPTRWLGWGRWPRYSEFGQLATHLRFVERRCRKLARASFHGMLRFGPALERKQAFLFRLVDIVNELFAMSASVARAHAMTRAGNADAAHAAELADVFCHASRGRVDRLFDQLWANHDVEAYRTAVDVLNGDHVWMERLIDNLYAGPATPAVAAAGARQGAAAG
jgi:alkylation response protein AidB-like acyl-CoA dehydrogenase